MKRLLLVALLVSAATSCSKGDVVDPGPDPVVEPFLVDADLAPRPTDERTTRLAAVQTWMYQLNELGSSGARAALNADPWEMLVVEPGYSYRPCDGYDHEEYGIPAALEDGGCADPWDAEQLVNAVRVADGGTERLIIAYIDIGQAEWFRSYWREGWRPPAADRRGRPDFVLAADPDGWSGNFVVAYWDPRWQSLWVGDDDRPGMVQELAAMGFDGIYLDWVEAYTDDAVIDAARDVGVDPAAEMVAFVEALGEAGREVTPDFLVIAQNAPFLVWNAPDPERYLRAIDALAVEDTWAYGNGDTEDWNAGDGDLGPYDISDRLACEADLCTTPIVAPDNVCSDPDETWECEDAYPVSGDLHGGWRHVCDEGTAGTGDCWSTANRVHAYDDYLEAGVPVFTVDYCISQTCADAAYDAARAAGLVPLVTRVQLSRVTDTRP